MDPNANLAETRQIVARIIASEYIYDGSIYTRNRDTDRLAELVEAMDGWMSKGGFLPAGWTKGRK